jgi:hypothetical protein
MLAGQGRLFTRVIAPALLSLPVRDIFQGQPALGEGDRLMFFENVEVFTFNGMAEEARRCFALTLAAVFERQLSIWRRSRHIAKADTFLETFRGVSSETGVDIDALKLGEAIEELYLLANAARHGDGPSLERLQQRAPDLWRHVDQTDIERLAGRELLSETIRVTDAHFRRYASALATFWGQADNQPLATKLVRYAAPPTMGQV